MDGSGKATLNTLGCSDTELDELQVYIEGNSDDSSSDDDDPDSDDAGSDDGDLDSDDSGSENGDPASEQVLWGSVAECASGPQPLAVGSSDRPPPTIILRGNGADKV